jgi:rubrerythrin
MADLIAANEIVRMSVEEERTGEIFYSAWAAHTQDPLVRAEAAGIAAMEAHHKEVFEKLLAKLGEPAGAESHAGEHNEYLDALMGDKAFPDAEAGRRLAQSESDMEVASIALKTEQKALLLYSFLEKQLSAADRKLIAGVIDEERQHVVQLTKIKARLQK